MKKILIILIGLFLFSKPALAADYQVLCDNTGCTGPATATFYEDNLAPGDSIIRTIAVKSAYGQTLNLTLTANQLVNTNDVLLKEVNITVIGLRGRTRFTGTLEQFLATPSVDLGHLFAFGTREIQITATLAQFGNLYQANKAWFDIPVSINVQGQAHDQGSGSNTKSITASKSQLKSLPISFWLPILGQVEGISSPSAETLDLDTISPGLFNQLKAYFRWWPWLLLLIPFSWWIFLLLFRKRQKR